jgi:hypothetical protein
MVPQHLPVVFEPNRGQAPAHIQWLAQGSGYQFLFTHDGVTIKLAEQQPAAKPGTFAKATTSRLTFAGGRAWDNISGLEPTGGVSNYLHLGNAPDSITGVPHYARLRVSQIYPGIDVDFYNDNGNLEYDLILRPGADPKQIRVALDGQRELRVDSHSGDLVAVMPAGGELHHIRPKVYQQVGDRRVEISASYALVKENTAAFALGAYDPTRVLTIDPTLQVFEFLGQSSMGSEIAADSDGNAYLAGNTCNNFPVTNRSQYDDGSKPLSFWTFLFNIFAQFPNYGAGFQSRPTDNNMFVAKVNPAGTILYATYFGLGVMGGIAVDSTGVVVTGWSEQSPSANVGPGNGIFVTKLSATGANVYDSVIDGSDTDMATGVALDSQHNAWVTGYTSSSTLTKGATPDKPDAVVFKVDPQGFPRSFKTYGGSGSDKAYAVAVDKADNVWITGQTCSPNDFPATVHLTMGNNSCGIFVAKLLSQSNTTKFANVFGGGDQDTGMGIAIDANGIAYVTGVTVNPNFPTSPDAYQRQFTGAYSQGFIMQADDAGDCLHATLIGSSGDTVLNSIALNAAGEVYVGGYTAATTFPGNGPVDPHPTAGLIMKFSPDLSTLLYSRQEGMQVNGVAIAEAVPAVTAAKIYTVGTEVLDPAHDGPPKAFFDVLADDMQYVRIRNYWKPDEYVNIESGAPGSGPIQPGWYSARWTLEQQAPIFGETGNPLVFWIHNFWKPDEYLNIENGLQSTTIGPEWLSARWVMEPVAGATNLYRIRNVWQPNLYLNNQNGALEATPVQPGWWSAMWTIERVY